MTATAIAHAQPKASPPPPLVGATEVVKLTAPRGYVDDVVAYDDQRLGYVIADTSAKAELHILSITSKHEELVDLAPVTLHPISVRFVGSRVFVVGSAEDGTQVAALVELAGTDKRPAGTVVYKLGPATHITVITRDGKPRVAVHTAVATKTGTRHEVELADLDTGKRIAAGKPIELDTADTDKQLELHVNHWADGMTHAIGIKGGDWDKKENQRSPDSEATYDLVTGRFVDRHPIADLFEQRKRYQALADAGGQLDFLKIAWDNSAVQVWRAGQPRSIELDQSITTYDPKSLQGVVNADGSAWIVLKVDPVNPEAVARKKADPEYLDVFRAGPDGKAVRRARILAAGIRHRFGVIGDRFWLLERSSGFDRGGRSLTIYQVP